MRKEVIYLFFLVAFMLGMIFGYVICDQQHERLYQEAKEQATKVEIQLQALQDDLDEVAVLDYFVEETHRDLRRLGLAIERLIYHGPKGTMTIDHSLFRLSDED
jgi:uncharacterized membrane-anchored protein YhcB (DUF1043 family)